ncbi:acyltransferase [Actinotalea sp. Marseille-Q4924]|uniref:acyltransferase family protein n=1 Tax=Actinotalea sp. Marseille-Q4924 TaxID=2866571 RepID=UPI001CE4B52A|nr:acyltransferase [Actinotalea sp. Marseille-Q4924]
MVTTRPSALGAPGRTAQGAGKVRPADTRTPTDGRSTAAPSSAGGTSGGTGGTGARDRMYALDGLRFAAAAGVVLYHFTARWHRGWGEAPGEVFPVLGHVATYFALAPELFFVVSGFVILWTAWGRSVPAVAASRLARIYPAYWAALALTSGLLMFLWRDGKQISWGEVAVNATLLQEVLGVRHVDGVYWTLWVELRFYLLIVLLVAIGLTRNRVLAFAGLWPAAAVLVGWADVPVLDTLLISQYAPLFAGGMLLYLLYRDGHARLPWVLLAGNVVLAVHTVVPAQMRSLSKNTVFEPNPWILAAVTVGCFVAVGAVALTRLKRISWAPLAALGALTYPLYLVHEFWGWWAIDRLSPVLPPWVVLGVAITLVVALAAALHHAIEKPTTPRVRRWLERTLTAWAAARAAGQAPGTPPTTPGGSDPSRIPAQSSALRASSS